MTESGRGEALFLIKALYGWLISSFLMILLFSLLIWKTSLDSSYIGYISSFISFSAAAISGLYSSKYIRASQILSGLICSGFITIALLTIGFIIEGNNMSSAGIISVSSFTFAGVMLGSSLRNILFRKNRWKKIKPAKR